MTGCVEANRIPAEPIAAVIRTYLGSIGDRSSEAGFTQGAIYKLAERADVNGDTLQKILIGRSKTIDFDIADRLLCVANLTDLWLTSLSEIYHSAQIPEGKKQFELNRPSGTRICARAGCSTSFIPPKHGKKKIYCSSNCRTTAWKHRRNGVKTRIRGKDRAIEKLICRHGHERTKENTGTSSRGHRYCMICHRAAQRRWEDEHRDRVKA